MNTSSESYEWFDMSISRDDEFKLLGERINIIEHAPSSMLPGLHSLGPREFGTGDCNS